MSVVRIAVVGAGNWGRNHVRTIASMADLELAAVCDTDDERRAELSRQYPGVRITESLDEAFEGADGVVVATPVLAHVPVAREALQRGLPALIEKPMALSVAEAQELANLVDETRVPVVSGHLLVFHPAIEYLQEIIRRGDLGTVYYLYSQRVNLGQVRPDENALWSFGPHDVSVALRLLDETPMRVAAHGKSYLQPGIEDVVFLLLEMPSGAMVHVQMSWLDPHKKRQLTVVGSRKMVVFDDMQAREKIKIYDKGVDRPPTYASYGESLAVREGEILIPRIPNVEPLRAELNHFAAVVRGEAEPRSGVQDGLEVVRILEAASESLRNGGRVIEIGSASARTT